MKVSDLGMSFDLVFGEQTAKVVSGMEEGEEMAPAVEIKDFVLDYDQASSSIEIEGSGAIGWVAGKITDVLQNKLFDALIADVTSLAENDLDDKINEDLYEYGSSYAAAGIGFDYALVQEPLVSNDNLLSLFFNGTFYSSTVQDDGTVASTSHPDVSLGSTTSQDISLHLSESVATSLLRTWSANDGIDMT